MSGDTIKRILRTGFISFWRNRWVSSATIGIMVIALGMITSLIILSAISDSVLTTLENKVDITVYFNLDTPEDEILRAKKELEVFPEVKEVEYVSRDEALVRFRNTHEDNNLIMQSLDELGDNPLEASLNIRARVISEYESIASFLGGRRFSSIIDTVNYQENRRVIERLSAIISMARRSGLVVSIILVLVAVLVTFNTIRLTMYSLRDEIGVMRLVGGSNWYIRGPFIVEGALYGIVGSVIAFLLFVPVVNFLSPKLISFLPGIVLSDYFYSNIWEIFILQTLIGIILGVASSMIAMRRYLKV